MAPARRGLLDSSYKSHPKKGENRGSCFLLFAFPFFFGSLLLLFFSGPEVWKASSGLEGSERTFGTPRSHKQKGAVQFGASLTLRDTAECFEHSEPHASEESEDH